MGVDWELGMRVGIVHAGGRGKGPQRSGSTRRTPGRACRAPARIPDVLAPWMPTPTVSTRPACPALPPHAVCRVPAAHAAAGAVCGAAALHGGASSACLLGGAGGGTLDGRGCGSRRGAVLETQDTACCSGRTNACLTATPETWLVGCLRAPNPAQRTASAPSSPPPHAPTAPCLPAHARRSWPPSTESTRSSSSRCTARSSATCCPPRRCWRPNTRRRGRLQRGPGRQRARTAARPWKRMGSSRRGRWRRRQPAARRRPRRRPRRPWTPLPRPSAGPGWRLLCWPWRAAAAAARRAARRAAAPPRRPPSAA